ncbi:DUF1752 domain-containing protein [Paenibacillus mucilaginosus]|nr:DUF1752 domain-containing protein [Paenibacillus mucilaginosus]
MPKSRASSYLEDGVRLQNISWRCGAGSGAQGRPPAAS